MNCEEELRKIVDATYEDGRMIVARIDVCNIATKQLLNLIDKSKQEGIRTVVEWIKEQGLVHRQTDWKCLQADDRFIDIYEVYPEDLQAFLKEQGVK